MDLIINDFVGDECEFGEQWPLKKQLNWLTDVVGYDTGSEQRNQILEQPRREWPINWQWLETPARDKLLELFNRAKGRYNSYLYRDREDFECSLVECIITAAGGETTTQLIKTYFPGEAETWSEDKKDIVPGTSFAPVVKIDGVAKTEGTHFTLDDTTGIIDWTGGGAPNGALGAGEVVTANYRFFFRVRFDDDSHMDIGRQQGYFTYDNLRLIEVVD